MDQARRLKLGAIFFTIFWIGGMLWWSGEYHPAYINPHPTSPAG